MRIGPSRRWLARLVLMAAIASIAAAGPASANHNSCHNAGDVWLEVVGVDPNPNFIGVCAGDLGVFFNIDPANPTVIGVTTCDFDVGCQPYQYFGVGDPHFIGTCLHWSLYTGDPEGDPQNTGHNCSS